MHNIHILLFAANSEDNNDNDLIFYEDSSLEHNENINENRDSDATQILANCESRKAPKTAIPSFRTRKTPYPLPTSKPAEESSSSSQNIHAPTSSRKCKAKILLYRL